MRFIFALIILASNAVSVAAFADAYSDRQNEYNQVQDAKLRASLKKEEALENQRTYQFLAKFAAAHGGMKGIATCEAFHASNDYEHKASVAETMIRRNGITVDLRYTSEDMARGTFVVGGGGSPWVGVNIEPRPTNCSFEMRDGTACRTYTETEDKDDDTILGVKFEADCISKGLNKSNVVLGWLIKY